MPKIHYLWIVFAGTHFASGLLSLARADVVTITNATYVGPLDTMISGVPLENAEIIVRGASLTMDGRHQIASLVLERNAANNGAVLTHSPAARFDYSGGAENDVVWGLELSVSGNVLIQGQSGGLSGSLIYVSGRGYQDGSGPGTGWSGCNGGGGGGGHGGVGGFANGGAMGGTAAYDSPMLPSMPGSSGGANCGSGGAAGGGVIQLFVTGTLVVEGGIRADGAAPIWGQHADHVGGGAGGSILIEANTLTGSGQISANGAVGLFRGGSGGGGRIAIYGALSSFTGQIASHGGPPPSDAWQWGGPGTVLVAPTGQQATLTVDNGAAGPSAATMLNLNTLPANLWVGANATLVAIDPAPLPYDLTVVGDVMVTSGGRIDATGKGYQDLSGPGSGSSPCTTNGGGGGGHGGSGGMSEFGSAGGIGSYGSVVHPETPGSAGGNSCGGVGAAGGGVLHLNVLGGLTVDGAIVADGASGSCCAFAAGGAGGSILINTESLAGSGVITANGGAGWGRGGGGGGGRVAVYYDSITFTGQVRARGAVPPWSGQRGGAGTVLLRRGFEQPTVIVENGAAAWSNTSTLNATTIEADLVIGPGAVLSDLSAAPATMQLTVMGELEVQSGGSIDMTGRGYQDRSGPGTGGTPCNTNGGGGGGHGGHGGRSFFGTPGGATYGDEQVPVTAGSAGGDDCNGAGGAGGGVIHLSVRDFLTLNGVIAADGEPGPCCNNHRGGGAGGSVLIAAGALQGSGTISAAGATGHSRGGNGGGGRIALYACNSNANGLTLNVDGALDNPEFESGGDGTTYVPASGGAAIVVTQQPQSSVICAGGSAQFSATILSSAPAAYQWQIETAADFWTDVADGQLPGSKAVVAGATTSEMTIVDVDAHASRRFRLTASSNCGEAVSSAATLSVSGSGDLNCNAAVTVGDIAGFVLALTDPAGYAAQYPNCLAAAGDVNCDGLVSVGDIGPFVQLLVGN